jgi:heptosyltransferase-2
MDRLLIVRNDRLGDVVLTLPAIELARRELPKARITVLVKPYTAPLLARNPAIDEIVEDDGCETAWALGRRLRRGRFTAALVINTNHRNAMAVWLAGIPRRVCWGYKPAGCLLGNRRVFLHRSRPPIHESRFAIAFLRRLGVGRDAASMVPCVDVDLRVSYRIEERIAREVGIQGALFGVHPGNGGSAFNWPVTRYIELVIELARRGRVVVTGSAEERELLRTMRAELPVGLRTRVAFLSDLSLMELAGVVRAVDVLTVSSTGPMHLAGVLRTPVAALFSRHPAHSPAKWAPLGDRHEILRPPGGPSKNVEIPSDQGETHMAGISLAEVLAANLRLLKWRGVPRGEWPQAG